MSHPRNGKESNDDKMDHLPMIDHRPENERLVRETRDLIQTALEYIDNQEDGPFTMRCALRDIDEAISNLETQLAMEAGSIERLQSIAQKLKKQRDKAMHQCELVEELLGWKITFD